SLDASEPPMISSVSVLVMAIGSSQESAVDHRRPERATGISRLGADRDPAIGSSPGQLTAKGVLGMDTVIRVRHCDLQRQDVANADLDRLAECERHIDGQPVR